MIDSDKFHKTEISKLQKLNKQLDNKSAFFKNVWYSHKNKKGDNKTTGKNGVVKSLITLSKSDIDVGIAVSLYNLTGEDNNQHKSNIKKAIAYAINLEHDDLVAKPDNKATQANLD